VSAHGVYLHGFGSGPRTAKGQALGRRLAPILASYHIPDLEAGDFTALTIDGILARARAAIAAVPDDGGKILVIGSSLGGYCAALLAATGMSARVGAMLLIAPAFGFPSRWAANLGTEGIAAWRREGTRPFYHHGAERDLPLGVGFLDSCQGLPDLPAQAAVPIALVHGRQDATVDCTASVAYARARERVELHLIEGDHRLTEPRHEDLIAWCAQDLLR
jgi:alpha-beta hydrolase superfamily lysophospholipase